MSRSKKSVTLLKHGNRLLVEPTTPTIADILSAELTFTIRVFHQGEAARRRKQMGLSKVELVDRQAFTLDHKARLVTPYGFWKRVKTALTSAGYSVSFKDISPWPSKSDKIFEPVWDNIKKYNLREGQPEFIRKVLSHRCGRIDCPPGFGKSFLIGLIASLLPKAKISIVTRRVAVLRERIYPELCNMVGNVGIVGGGLNRTGRRVMCYTEGSMHKARDAGDAHILFGDECHELAADRAASRLMAWDRSRNYGLSASHDMRLDGKNYVNEGVFGPVIYRVDYQQAQENGLVTPIKIHWSDVTMSVDPTWGCADNMTAKKRHGIWRNEVRNAVIANDANKYDDDTQVLITCETLDHAAHLKSMLPNFTLVYREDSLTPIKRARYAKMGLIDKDEPLTNTKRRVWLTKQFEKGELKKVMATPVRNVGVSFNALQVLIRAGGMASPINDIQIPGRDSRISDGKTHGVVHDYLDQFNSTFAHKAKGRSRMYKKNGWEQIMPSTSTIDDVLFGGD